MHRKKILVPVNFSSQSDAALVFAVALSGTMHGVITCLHVIDDPGQITGGFISGEIAGRIRREAEQRLSMVANRIIDDKKIPFEVIITSGKVHRKIMEKAVDLNASIIVMGRSDSGFTDRNAIGSNANMVITHARIPVVTVGSNRFTVGKNILLPLDLSKPVGSKLAMARDVARLFDARISILTVAGTLQGGLEKQYRQKLGETVRFFEAEGIRSGGEFVISDNPVPGEIMAHASKIGAGLIMVMTQQERGITDQFIGSTAREIMNKSELPILSVLPEPGDGEPTESTSLGNLNDPISLLTEPKS